MRRVAFVVPGRLDAATGGSRYDRMMVEGLRRRGWLVDVRELAGSFPWPSAGDRQSAADAIASIPAGTVTIVDGLVLGSLSGLVQREAARLSLVALVHLPVAADVALDAGLAARLEAGERQALAAVRTVVVTGKATLALLERYGIERDDVVVIEPGTARRPVARGGDAGVVRLLCVATLQPGKGHSILLEALAALSRRPRRLRHPRRPHQGWHLTCAGSLTRDPLTAEDVRDLTARLGLEGDVTFTGELDEPALAARYDESDVFVLATRQETYGMAVAEAVAHGLPVVSTTCGAIPDIVGEHAGVLVRPDDVVAFTAALRCVIDDGALRAQLADGARRMRDLLPTPEHAAARFEAVLDEIHAHG